MNDKRNVIMTTAKALFIEQGIRGTTIAGIAEHAGIAKGSVYSYFKSKLAIVKALLNEAEESSRAQIDDLLNNSSLQGQALLHAHIMQQLEQAKDERAFQQALLNDDSWAIDQDILNFVQSCRANYARLQKTILLRVFGDELVPWVLDMVTMLNALLQEYSIYIMVDDAEFSYEHCAAFICYSLSLVARDVSKTELTPVLDEKDFPLEVEPTKLMEQRAEIVLEKMKSALHELDKKERLLAAETLDMLQKLIEEDIENATLSRALIANLRPYDILSKMRAELADIFDVELI